MADADQCYEGHCPSSFSDDEDCDSDGAIEEDDFDSDFDDGTGRCRDRGSDDGYSAGVLAVARSDLRQHLAAVALAVVAAVVAHSRTRGGYVAWRDELSEDWNAFRSRLLAAGRDGKGGGATTTTTTTTTADDDGRYNAAAPSMDAIPLAKRRRALDRALGRVDSGASTTSAAGDGHERARDYRRTGGLRFCPENGSVVDMSGAVAKSSASSDGANLAEMEFILPLEPSVRVLHSHYLADAFGTDSSMVYGEFAGGGAWDLGSYGDDAILKEIDVAIDDEGDGDDGPATSIDRVESIVRSRLPPPVEVDRQHICLLHQYALNKPSGRAIRGTTMVYDRPHVSTFHRDKHALASSNYQSAAAAAVEPNHKVAPASLTFTGFAVKFVNLSSNPINLHWDGGRVPSGPRAGEVESRLVGTIPAMGSVGTASFPGHDFYVAPTYDGAHQLRRWTVTEDEAVLYYDPMDGMSPDDARAEVDRLARGGAWTDGMRFDRDAWAVDRSFGRDYLIKTGDVWLANFPQPYLNINGASDAEVNGELPLIGSEIETVRAGHDVHMWPAEYIGQAHTLETSNLYFTALPHRLERLTVDDYVPENDEKRRSEMMQFQSSTFKEKKNSSSGASTMSLTLKVASVTPRVLEVKKFLSPIEAQHLIDLASGAKGGVTMQRSTVSASAGPSHDDDKGKKVRGTQDGARTSTGGWVHREQDAVVDTIFRRIADLLNVDERLMRDQVEDYEPHPKYDRIVEAMQLLRYGPGEEYSAHHDFTYPPIGNRYQPKRYATVLMYLNGEGDDVEGGETTFPRAVTTNYHDGVKIAPQSGKAILFYNVLPDGNMDDLSQHSGGKVKEGVKYVANVWVWDPIVN